MKQDLKYAISSLKRTVNWQLAMNHNAEAIRAVVNALDSIIDMCYIDEKQIQDMVTKEIDKRIPGIIEGIAGEIQIEPVEIILKK